MRIILSIIKNELKQRLSSWVSIIFFLMLVFQAILFTKGTFDLYVNERVLMNAPSILYGNYAGMGMLMLIIIAIATGGVLYNDIQYKSAQWTYAMPINDKHFFIGRFLAAYLYLVIISIGMIVGHLLLPYSGIGEAESFGPTPWGQLFHGWLMFTVPNLLLYVGLVFFAIVFTRRMTTGYLAVFAAVILFLLADTSYGTAGENKVVAYLLMDPNGFVAANYYSELLTSAEKNTDYFHLSGFILQNRLLWFTVAILFAVAAYSKFSFKYFIQAGVDKTKKLKQENKGVLDTAVQLPQVVKHFRTPDFLKKLWTLSKLEFLNIVRPTSFKLILGIILLMVFLQNVTWNATYYIGKEVPISSNMTYFRLAWGVFMNMLIMIWAGELFFKDKTVNIWQITDALPVPVWVTQLSRFVAIICLSFVLSLSFIAISIFTQVLLGGAAYIDLGRFTEDLLLHRWGFLNFVLYAALVFFIAAISGHRILTHIISVGFFLFLVIAFDLGILEDLRVVFALPPGVEDFSEISGYGIFRESANWFFLLWLSLSAALIMAGVWLWQRGTDKKWGHRLSLKNRQLSPLSKGMMLACFGAFFLLMSFISRNAYDNGNFTSEVEQERLDAAYEKQYKYLETRKQPKYAEVDLELDLFPSERRASYSANIILVNELDTDTLFLNWKDFVTVSSLMLNGQDLKLVKKDKEQSVSAYLIPRTLHTDSVLYLSLKAEKQYVGFTQSDVQADLTYVGSFASVQDFLPVIGYDSNKELLENRKRQGQGLNKLSSRMAPVNDSLGLSQSAFSIDAYMVKGSITISTEEGQFPFAAGKLTKKEVEGDRPAAHYRIEQPQVFNWYVGSSDYTKVAGQVNGIGYAMLHKPSHTFNLNLYEDAINKGIAFMQKHFGVEAVANKLQLVEIHRWQDPNYIFANTIALSEKEGWLADTEGLQEQAYIYQTVGSGMAGLWIQQNVGIANVQGGDMLAKALPEAIGLQFVKETFGEEAVQLLIKKKMDKYGKDRNNEPNTEPPLIYADGADYLEENKGAVVLYEVIEEIGLEKFSKSLVGWSDQDGTLKTFKDFLSYLKQEIKSETYSKFTLRI